MLKKPKILIVDDDSRSTRVIEAMLSPEGYRTILASDGEEALDKAISFSPDVILLDVMMPKLSGLEVTKFLKRNDKTKIIPVVIITALDNVEDRVKTLEAGADDFLNKPVEKTELRARVKSLVKIKAYNENVLNYQKNLEADVERKTRQLRKALKKIEAALNEKEVMLHEIHHRVKNNMQIIVSLLRLQSRQIKQEDIKELCNVSYNRIMSMALIHEILYRSKDLAGIDFCEYVRRMTSHLFFVYKDRVGDTELKIEIDDINLDINNAIPCGLIINELVTNSIKHAFTDRRNGLIGIKMLEDVKGNFTLTVADNGAGLPKNLDYRNPGTLGLQLVNDLVNQIEGNMEVDKKGGTAFVITW